jgi:hypothetical protein
MIKTTGKGHTHIHSHMCIITHVIPVGKTRNIEKQETNYKHLVHVSICVRPITYVI